MKNMSRWGGNQNKIWVLLRERALPLAFSLSCKKLQRLKNQVRPAGGGRKPRVEGTGWRRLPHLNFLLQLTHQNRQALHCALWSVVYSVCETQRYVHTIEVLVKVSALKMLSSRLKKLIAISSTAAGLLWHSSTILQWQWFVTLI